MSTRIGPDFVCIGAQKGGTTWLYENLSKHPEVWMPPVKEIHYFNRLCVNKQLLGDWSVPHPNDLSRYYHSLIKLKFKDLRWMSNYYEYSMASERYLELFSEKYTGKYISGDVTPAYSTLEENGVSFASKVLDKNVPIFFIMRNPIYRTWSVLKMLLRYRKINVEDVSNDEIMSMLQQPKILLGSEYTKIITLWKKHFANFHILTFDELCESPRELLTKVSNIIDVSDKWDEDTINKRVWADDKKTPMPASILKLLTEQYTAEIQALDKIVDFDCEKNWLENDH